MRRADRLFQIIQLLRRRRITTARRLADELEVSERTIYRDIQDLIRSGVPIDGEAGVGYALARSFELPPLMFTADEIEALAVGARMVQSWTDPALARAARRALGRVEAVLPDDLRSRLDRVALLVPDFHVPAQVVAALGPLRAAIDDRRKVALRYEDAGGAVTARVVRPLGLTFWGATWSLVAWCELRGDFRSFRLDRMRAIEASEARFPAEPGRELDDFLRAVRAE